MGSVRLLLAPSALFLLLLAHARAEERGALLPEQAEVEGAEELAEEHGGRGAETNVAWTPDEADLEGGRGEGGRGAETWHLDAPDEAAGRPAWADRYHEDDGETQRVAHRALPRAVRLPP